MVRHETVWCGVTVLVMISAIAMCGPSPPAHDEEGIAIMREEMKRLGYKKEFSDLSPEELVTLKASVKARMGVSLNAGTEADIPSTSDNGKPSPPSPPSDGKKKPDVPVKSRANPTAKQTPGAPAGKPPASSMKKDGKAPGSKGPGAPKKDGKTPSGERPSASGKGAKPPATKPPNKKKAKIEL